VAAAPGWYPDPGGGHGLFRYWDGRAWASVTTTDPRTPGPSPARRTPAKTGLLGFPRQNRRTVAWTFAGIGVLLVIGLVMMLVIRGLMAMYGSANPGPMPNPTGLLCPPAIEATATPTPDPGDRVRSGRLSYPRLAQPFSAPHADSRTPFGRDVRSQEATVETDAQGDPRWVAGVLIARLLAGDGFYGPQQGAQVVAGCVVGKFYGDAVVQREDRRSEAITIDGHDAWIIEMHLSFDIPGILTKGELATVVVVDTGTAGDGEAGLFYSSIPDTSPQFTAPAKGALEGLRVG
jgi:hypothetical protein